MCGMGLLIFRVRDAVALTLSAFLTMSMTQAEVRVSSNSADQQTARLQVGDSVQIDGASSALTFKTVQRDSRCPNRRIDL